MLAYKAMQAQLASLDTDVMKQHAQVVIVPEIADHEDEAGSVHVDALRAMLDWVRAHHPSAKIALAASARRHTPLAFEEFGMHHLQKEYPGLSLVDLNKEPLPSGYHVLICKAAKDPGGYWRVLCKPAERRFHPDGVVWQRDGEADVPPPHLVVVDKPVYHGN